jgi:hypothetical protein
LPFAASQNPFALVVYDPTAQPAPEPPAPLTWSDGLVLFFTALNLFAMAAFYVINLMPKAFSYRLRLSGNFIRTFNIVMLNCIVMQGTVAQSFGAGEVRRTATRTLKGEKTNQGEEQPFKANMLLPASGGEEGRKLAVTLSGSNTGQCAVNGNCFSSLNYGNDESCTFTMGGSGTLTVISFNTEIVFDMLTVGGIQYDGTTGPQGVAISAGEEISWYSDEIETRAGFEICVASTPPVSGHAVSITPMERKLDHPLQITLSGSNLGNCAVDGSCFSSLSYTNNEVCEFTTDVAGVLSVISFATGENRQKARRKLPSDNDMENVGRASHTYSFPCLLTKLTPQLT